MELVFTKKRKRRTSILIEGWINIPHSYAIVNCMQLIHMIKLKDKYNFEFYIKEVEYYNANWNNNKKLVFSDEYNTILNNVTPWKGEEVDLIYRISFPYNVSVHGDQAHIPTCVFFTAEFATLDVNYFKMNSPNYKVLDDHLLETHFRYNKEMTFVTPSEWSKQGMKSYIQTDIDSRVKVIPHGVDTSVFYRDLSKRKDIRAIYGVEDGDLLLMNIGSMTQNKGIMEILVTLKLLVFDANMKNIKLLLKGTQDLYESRKFLERYLTTLIEKKVITEDQSNELAEKYIKFTDKTFSSGLLNDLYNACDVYISPYLAEGFNLTVLEALTVGLHVLVSENGSTVDYINDILKEVPSADKYIHKIPTKVIQTSDKKMMNNINVVDIANVVLRNREQLKQKKSDLEYTVLLEYIQQKYSWKVVAEQLCEYMMSLIKN